MIEVTLRLKPRGRAGGRGGLTIIMVHHNHTHQSPCRLMTLQGGINLRHDSQETRKIDTAAQLKYLKKKMEEAVIIIRFNVSDAMSVTEF